MPLIWVLTGSKTGDNAQVLRAAQAIGLPFEVKRIVLKPGHETAKPAVRPSLDIVDVAASDPFTAPWPDLVITIGRRLSLPALWIREQSGAKSRIALFNAPKGRAEDFALIIVPAHYTLADGPRVCRIGLPLIAADPARIEAAGKERAAEFAALAQPVHVLLLGGDMGARKLDPAFATATFRTMQDSFAASGSIYVSTSRRTPPAAADALERILRPQDRLYRWREKADDNPYFALLAHGGTFTVTSDSLSMLTEVARLGRPPARDLGEAAGYLVRTGHAVRLGQALPAAADPPDDDTARVASRLRRMALGQD